MRALPGTGTRKVNEQAIPLLGDVSPDGQGSRSEIVSSGLDAQAGAAGAGRAARRARISAFLMMIRWCGHLV
jgi:hypothetical protein